MSIPHKHKVLDLINSQSDEAMSLKTSEISIETLQSTESIALDDHRSMTEQSTPQPQNDGP